jgi:hypothetical protein
MPKLIRPFNLFLFLLLLSSCSKVTDSSDTIETINKCEKIRPMLAEKLISPNKSERLGGWQLMVDYPSCFPTGNIDLAKKEIEALKQEK